MSLPIKLILFLCTIGCFPPCQAAALENDHAEMYVTFVKDYRTFYPIALFRNGESFISYMDMANDLGCIWYFTLQEAFIPLEEQLKKETFYGYTSYSSQMTVQKSVIDNDKIFPLDPLYGPVLSDETDLSKAPIVVTNDSSPDFFADAQYTQYTIAEQDKVPDVYKEYVRKKVHTAGLVNVPILIRDVYEFDFDNDGKNEAFIAAHNYSNYAPKADDIAADEAAQAGELKTEDGIGYYSYVLFYSETYTPIDFQAVTALLHDSFYPTEYQAPGAIYEYNQHGEPQLFNIYIEDEYEMLVPIFVCGIDFLAICDVNHDGLYDFIIMHDPPLIYRPIELYLQNADGDFIRICGMYTHA